MHSKKDLEVTSEPIAIVSMAFRLPGDVSDEGEFWNALLNGHDFITSVPADRWAVNELQHSKRSEPGRSVTYSAGVLSKINEFDADFFGISPREAAMLDPQHRILLELAWESMENAGYQPSSLEGTNCAVYVGVSGLDYGTRGLDDLSMISAHTMTGNTLSIAANRLSYVFDLRGPSLAVDTACSSSLVALHHACRSIQSGESSMALVGGVNVLLHPYPFIGFTKASMLSADGRCKAFDASGDGYVRSEGGVVLLLKPLKNALRDGDNVQAVILSSGVNADGARKTGITIPSSEGQAELMQLVLQQAGLAGKDIDFVEAHGTGTVIGDPIEALAIGSVYGKDRQNPLPIGSVKANIGHLEPASGLAGLVKTVLALKNQALPPAAHLKKPNTHIDFSGLNIELVQNYKKLTKVNGKPLIAGLNSFGFGGANAHVLLQEFQSKQVPNNSEGNAHQPIPPLFLSAKTDAALRDMAASYNEYLQGKTLQNFYDVAYAAATTREQMTARLALKPLSVQDAIETLSLFSEGAVPAKAVFEEKLKEPGSVAFVYAGNGAQWHGMCKVLMAQSPRFTEILNSIDAVMEPVAGFSIIDELTADESNSRIDDTKVVQPLLFAIQAAITLLLKESGVTPFAVTGHSVGEVAAAWAAGAFDLEQAVHVICARSSAQALTRGSGRMAAVAMSELAMRDFLSGFSAELDIEIAGINGPNNVTISGNVSALQSIQVPLEAKGVFFRLLDIDYAFHNRQMDVIAAPLRDSLEGLRPSSTAESVFISTVTGDALPGEALDADYWWKNVRQPVQFADAINSLVKIGCRIFVEIGPNAILQRYITECLSIADVSGRVLPSLRKESHGIAQIEELSLRIQLLTEKPDLSAYFPIHAQKIRLPNYPWQREHHWHVRTSESFALLDRVRVHPLLGWRQSETELAWENTIDSDVIPWLVDHQVGGAIVFPGSAYAEMALAAAREWLGAEQFSFEELDIISPLVFDGEHARTLHFNLNQRDGSFQILSRQRLSKDGFTLHAAGRILSASSMPLSACINPPLDFAEFIDKEAHYELTAKLGLNYGATFQGLASARISGNCLEATLSLPITPQVNAYILHPALLDVCFQSLVDFFRDQIRSEQGIAFLPIKIGKLVCYRQSVPTMFRVQLKRFNTRSVLADFELFDESQRLVAKVSGCRFRAAPLLNQKGHSVSEWQTISRLQPHPKASCNHCVITTGQLVDYLQNKLVDADTSRQLWFKEILPLFEALTVSYAFEAFQLLAANNKLDSLLEQTKSPFVLWIASILEKQNLLSRIEAEAKWQLVLESDIPKSDEIWRHIISNAPTCLPQLLLLGRVGQHLSNILTGEIDGNHYLQSLMKSISAEVLYSADQAYIGIEDALEKSIFNLIHEWPTDRKLRVLEVATDPSTLPRRVLSMVDEDRVDYVLAVSDEDVLQHQQSDCHEFTNLAVANIDLLDASLDSEKTLPDQFDVVVFRHSLHHFDYPHVALAKAKRLLSSGGVLLIAERYPDLSINMISGVSADWWGVDTGQHDNSLARVSSPLVAPEVWEQELIGEGFEDISCYTEQAAEGFAQGAYLVLAKRLSGDSLESLDIEKASWLLVKDQASSTLISQLKARLELASQNVIVADTAVGMLDGVDHVVHLLGWDLAPEDASGLVGEVLTNLQEAVNLNRKTPRLWLITRGGALASNLPHSKLASPLQSALWGLGRVVMNEYPAVNCKLIDLRCALDSEETLVCLENELLNPDDINEIVLAECGRYSLSMREKVSTTHVGSARHDESERYHLDFQTAGQLRNLSWMPTAVTPLLDHQVEVSTKATGLNFRDIMYLMGLLPDEAVEKGFAGASLGLEFSGVVTRVGAGVQGFNAGDAVMGFGASCFASHVVTNADAITLMPAEWTFEAAATIPTTFFTVYYALTHLADIQPGEKVLIHGAAGGVGIAAIQLARHIGVEIFATAGSEEKRDFVRLLGADHVFDSRSLTFADEILAATSGEGVDVVLNSLAGEAIRRNLAVLKPFGRFLELGKRDFFENTPIGLRPFKDNISYFGIDADQLLTGRPALASRLFGEVMALFREGVLSPLPYRAFEADRVIDAFRVMQQARHIGKVVVTMNKPPSHIQGKVKPQESLQLEPNSTWLITGGLSGFGLESARWLVQRGVKNLVLVSRRGMQTPDADNVLEEFKSIGVNVLAKACDITNAAALDKLIKLVQKTMPPLKGILHAAMVIDDRLIANLDKNSLQSVINPKLVGAWNLHSLTLDIPLEHFVLYSSITTYIGNPGQANYVAANAGLEGLAEMRKGQGLPASCIGWGPIADAGYLTRNTAVKDSLAQRLGKQPISASDALKQLDKVLFGDSLHAIANFDWSVLSRVLPSASGSRFNHLNRTVQSTGNLDDNLDFQSMIVGKSKQEVQQIICEIIIYEVSKILCINAEKIDASRSLHDLGMDSLMAVELALGLERKVGIQLPAMMLSESPTAEGVAIKIVEKIFATEDDVQENATDRLVQDLARQHGEHHSTEEIGLIVEGAHELAQQGAELTK